MTITDEDIEKLVHSRTDIQETSKRAIVERLRSLRDAIGNGVSFMRILVDPDGAGRYLELADYTDGTRRAIASAAVSVVERCPPILERFPRVLDRWKDLATSFRARGEADAKEQKARETSGERDRRWERLLRARDAIKDPSSQARALLWLYTELPPMKNVLARVRVFREGEKPEEKLGENHLVLGPKARLEIVVEGRETVPVPAKVAKVVDDLLESRPEYKRRYLFLARSGEPYADSVKFGSWANGVLKRETGIEDLSIDKVRTLRAGMIAGKVVKLTRPQSDAYRISA